MVKDICLRTEWNSRVEWISLRAASVFILVRFDALLTLLDIYAVCNSANQLQIGNLKVDSTGNAANNEI